MTKKKKKRKKKDVEVMRERSDIFITVKQNC